MARAAILPKLFGRPLEESDHRWFKTMWRGRTPLARDLRRFSAITFNEFEHFLDDDFPSRFRKDTPQRFSELFYAAAFRSAGWEPIDRVTGFDFAFAVPSGGRLLVEISTPAPQAKDTWHEEQIGPVRSVTGDGKSKDAALLRLTTAFAAKESIIRNAIQKGRVTATDYKVIAISGVRISQEARISISANGNPPEFARAFLPLGDLATRVTFNRNTGVAEFGPIQNQFSDGIGKKSGNVVPRNALVSGEFPHVDAVAYSEVSADGLDRPNLQVSVLHNPTSARAENPIFLRMAREFVGTIDGDELQLQPHRLPEIAEQDAAEEEARRHMWDELFKR